MLFIRYVVESALLTLSSHLEDLAGLKVSHDLDELNEGEDRILTLKDSRILDNEGLNRPNLKSYRTRD